MLPITIVLVILSCYELDRFFENVFLYSKNEIKKIDLSNDFDIKFEIYDFYHNKTNNYPSKRHFDKNHPRVKHNIYTYPYQFMKISNCNDTYEIEYTFNKTEQVADLGKRNLNGEAMLVKRNIIISDGVEKYAQKMFDFVNGVVNSGSLTCKK